MVNLEKIIENCKKEDVKAQEMLYLQFSSTMYGICLRYARNKEEAEDNLQDGFVKIFKTIKTYAGRGSFEGWMKRIFINVSLEKYRKEKKMLYVEDTFENYVGEETTINNSSNISEKQLLKFIQELPDQYRNVFNLYAIEGYSHKEIATMLKISEGTSKSNLSRARIKLKVKVKTHQDKIKV